MADLRDIRSPGEDGGSFELVGGEDFATKACNKCGTIKGPEDFHVGKSICKRCRSIKQENTMVKDALNTAAYRLLRAVTGL